jgi:D-alanyl-lipoteichoic acid acyltransferase DltB (MBOAT superfamily)
MLFNSYPFLLLFLPVSLLAYHGLVRLGMPRAGVLAVTLLSLVFYAQWEPAHLPVLILSIAGNLSVGRLLLSQSPPVQRHRRLLLIAGVTANLLALGYYKYAGFLLANLAALAGREVATPAIALPIGISFFTFLQIAYLVDCFHRKGATTDWLRYAFFVSFFPHLIAGPLLHLREMVPQLDRDPRARFQLNLAVGLCIFTIGLFKKVVVADTFALPADTVFDQVHATRVPPELLSAWSAALGYTFQIYFDFSAYSDMAVGLSRMFGIRMPINFASPYKATSIVDFWHRWHITLSRFLRDYLYIPLGGGRHGRLMRYRNLLLVMLIGGLWHGAGWTFVAWGAIHGLLLAGNHLWRDSVVPRLGATLPAWPSRLLTFIAMVLAWVPFRAADFDTAWLVWGGMAGLNGVVLPTRFAALAAWWPGAGAGPLAVPADYLLLYAPLALAACWLLPNTYEIARAAVPAIATRGYPATWARSWSRSLRWRPAPAWSVATAMVLATCLLKLNDVSPFIYFQF